MSALPNPPTSPTLQSVHHPLRSPMHRTVLIISLALCSLPATAQLDDIFKKADDALNHRNVTSLSDDKIISGLKQALEISTSKAVANTGKPDGFLKNEA